MAGRTYVAVPLVADNDQVEMPLPGTPAAPCFRGNPDDNFSHAYSVSSARDGSFAGKNSLFAPLKQVAVCTRCGSLFELVA